MIAIRRKSLCLKRLGVKLRDTRQPHRYILKQRILERRETVYVLAAKETKLSLVHLILPFQDAL